MVTYGVGAKYYEWTIVKSSCFISFIIFSFYDANWRHGFILRYIVWKEANSIGLFQLVAMETWSKILDRLIKKKLIHI